jgi:hypothetical protein
MILESNADAFLVAIPMVALLVAGFFRLDELFARNGRSRCRRRTAGLDERGMPVCLDPDGRQFRR